MVLVFRATENLPQPGVRMDGLSKKILKYLIDSRPGGVSVAAMARNVGEDSYKVQERLWELARQDLAVSEYV